MNSSSKRRRVTTRSSKCRRRESSGSRVYQKVLCRADHLGIICKFLTIADVAKSIIPLSVCHVQFINNKQHRKLVYILFGNYFATNYLNLLNIKLKYNDNNHENFNSIFEQINTICTDWDQFLANCRESKYVKKSVAVRRINHRYSLSQLIYLKNVEILKHWVYQVMSDCMQLCLPNT